MELLYAWIIALASFITLSGLIFFLLIDRPLRKVILEMNKLLSGQKYSRLKVQKKNEWGALAYFFNEVTRNLEKISSTFQSEDRIHKELNAAQRIQKNLLPTETPKFPNLDIQSATIPASEIGGDAYSFIEKEGRYFLYIGDSTGHGIPAGIVMVMVNLLIQTFLEKEEDLRAVLIESNKYLKPHMETTMFMTLALLEWLPEKNQFVWCGAGHEHLLHLDIETKQANAYPTGGIALGMLPDNTAQVEVKALNMSENDFLILYSDGITEAKNVMGENYGLKRLSQSVQNFTSKERDAKTVLNQISEDVTRFMSGQKQADDMTLIVIKKTSAAPKKTNEGNSESPSAPTNEEPV